MTPAMAYGSIILLYVLLLLKLQQYDTWKYEYHTLQPTPRGFIRLQSVVRSGPKSLGCLTNLTARFQRNARDPRPLRITTSRLEAGS
jgi:hypothetical protein